VILPKNNGIAKMWFFVFSLGGTLRVARRLSIEKGMLKIKDLESYQSIEDLVKFSKVLPPNIHS